MNRLVNPVTRRLLRSPAHRLLGAHVALVEYAGRRTGRPYATPVNVREDGGALVARSRPERRWWRNLSAGTPVTVVHRGHRFPAAPEVTEEPGAVRILLRR